MSWLDESKVAYAVAQLLADEGHGTPGTDLFVDVFPDKPDAVVSIHQSSGLVASQHLVLGRQGSSVASLALHARGAPNDAKGPRARLWEVWELLCGTDDFSVGDVTVIGVVPLNDPELLERDDEERSTYHANIDVAFRLS